MKECKIYGPKTSFDRDIFEKISDNKDYILLKDISLLSKEYKKLSLSQRYICNLLTNYEKTKKKLSNKYLSVCLKKKKNRLNENYINYKIISYGKSSPDERDKIKGKSKKIKYKSKKIKGKSKKIKRKSKKTKNKSRNIKRNIKRKTKKTLKTLQKKNIKIIYFFMKGCKYCKLFEKIWTKINESFLKKRFHLLKINGPQNKELIKKYHIKQYPTIIKIKNNKSKIFKNQRTYKSLSEFIQK